MQRLLAERDALLQEVKEQLATAQVAVVLKFWLLTPARPRTMASRQRLPPPKRT